MIANIPIEFQALRLVDDPVDSDDELPDHTTTPSYVKSYCAGRALDYARLGYLTQVPTDLLSWQFNLAPSVTGRINATMPIHVAPWFTQFSGQVRPLTF